MTQQEVLAFGEDRPPRQRRPALVGAALVCLATGFVAGVRFTEPAVSEPPNDGGAEPGALPVVVSGALAPQSESVGSPGFRIPLYNAGDQPVHAALVEVRGWTGPVSAAPWTTIPPNRWGILEFWVSPDCDTAPREAAEVAHIRLDWESGSGQRSVDLPQSTDALSRHHDIACARREVPSHDLLSGAWIVEDGPAGFPVGTLIRFERDGDFTLDPSGASVSRRPWMHGSYFLRRDGHMVLENGSASRCPAVERFDWVVELVGDDDHLLVQHRNFLGGSCQVGSGVWMARRLPDDRVSDRRR